MVGSENNLIPLWPGGAPLATGVSDEDCPAITPYLAEGGGDAAVVVIPGGGYQMRADHEGEPIAKWLNSIGIHAFVLRYRVHPYLYPCAFQDASRAVRFVRHHAQEWGIDRGKVGVLGFSAGGHLTSTVGTHYDLGDEQAVDPIERQSSRPDLLVLCYPVIAMDGPYHHTGSRHNLLGAEADADQVELLSNERQVTPDTPPTFLWHTSDDEIVDVENSLLFASALRRNNVPFDLHVYEKGPHGLGLAENDPHVASWTTVCSLWFKRYNFY